MESENKKLIEQAIKDSNDAHKMLSDTANAHGIESPNYKAADESRRWLRASYFDRLIDALEKSYERIAELEAKLQSSTQPEAEQPAEPQPVKLDERKV